MPVCTYNRDNLVLLCLPMSSPVTTLEVLEIHTHVLFSLSYVFVSVLTRELPAMTFETSRDNHTKPLDNHRSARDSKISHD